MGLIATVEPRGHSLLSVLCPLLRARILMPEAGGSSDKAMKQRCADLLVEAGVALASNPLARWSAEHQELRQALHPNGPKKGDRGPLPSKGDGSPSTRTLALSASRSSQPPNVLVVKSPGMKRLLQTLQRLRKSELPVLVEGETGSGKEIVARLIHEGSPRGRGPFLTLDSGAIPESLLEVALCGALQGAH